MILLDSHSFYWLVTDEPRFGSRARHKLASSSNVYVSSLSILELTIKALATRLPALDLNAAMKEARLKELNFMADDATQLESLPAMTPRDPFDRALLAQAAHHRLDFYTADKKLLALGLPWVVNIGE